MSSPGVESAGPERLRGEVDRFGRPAHKHDLLRRRRANKLLNDLARILISICGPGSECMDRAMDVGIVVLVEVA